MSLAAAFGGFTDFSMSFYTTMAIECDHSFTEIAMTFFAYRQGTGSFTSEGRDESAGILGKRLPSEEPPIATAPTLEELEREAWAYLGKEPDAHLLLTDSEGNVRALMSSVKHHEAIAIARAEGDYVISVVYLIFSLTCLLGVALGGVSGTVALLSFVGVVSLYILMLRTKFMNEAEGALVCEIMLIFVLLLIPAIQKVRDHHNRLRNQPPPQSAAAIWIGYNDDFIR